MIIIHPENFYVLTWNNRNKLHIVKKTTDYLLLDCYKDNLFKSLIRASKEDYLSAKNVYFDPNSKYPRSKFTENSDKKRVIKAENADVIVCPDLFIPSNTIWINKILKDGDNYFYNLSSVSVDINCIVPLPFQQINNLEECTFSYSYCYLINKKEYQSLENIVQGYYTKIISDSELDIYVNQTLLDVNDEQYIQLRHMLSSSDDTVVELGLKLLSSYNIIDNKCKIGILLYDTYRNIINNKGRNSVFFQQLLSTLNITPQELYSELYYKDSYKRYVQRLIVQSNNTDDILFAKNYLAKCFSLQLQKQFDKWNENFINLDMNLELKIN